jgi:hypothetical protein
MLQFGESSVHAQLLHSSSRLVVDENLKLCNISPCQSGSLRYVVLIVVLIIMILLLQATGIGISVQVIKIKLAPVVLKEVGIGIRFGKGICHESEILDMASIGVIVKDGSGYWINSLFLVDKAAAQNFLHENAVVADEICNIMGSQANSLKGDNRMPLGHSEIFPRSYLLHVCMETKKGCTLHSWEPF